MKSVHLQQKVEQELRRVGLKVSEAQLKNLALLSHALAVSNSCHLSELALGLPIAARRENLIQRLRRYLKGGEYGWQRCYGQLVRHLFAHWQGREVALVMDRTDIGQRLSILVVGAAYQKRLLPLNWRVLPFGGTGAAVQKALLRPLVPYLPKQCRIHFYGDCEFRATDLQGYCQQQQWHWQTGVKSDTYVTLTDGAECQLRELPLDKGERRFWQQVYLTKEHFGPVNLIADWSPNQDFPRFWSLDLPADPSAWRRGRKRFWIEPSFRDWKSYGFDLEASQLEDPQRLEVLLLGMAVTTLWMIHLGDWLTQHGDEAHLDRSRHPDYSLFRRGRDHVTRCRTMGWSIPVGFTGLH